MLFVHFSLLCHKVSTESLMNHKMQYFYDYFFTPNPNISKYTGYQQCAGSIWI